MRRPQRKPGHGGGRTTPLAEDVVTECVRLIDAGLYRNEIARQLGISAGIVTRIAQRHGRTFDRSRLKAALPALEAFTHERRLRFYAKAVTVAEDKLDAVLAGEMDISARDLQALSTSVAIDHDKTRLELGESTQNIAHNVAVHVYLPDNGRSIADNTLPAPDTAPVLLPGPAADAELPQPALAPADTTPVRE